MSQNPESDSVDELLERGLAQRAPSDEHIAALTKRIQQELLSQTEVKQSPPRHPSKIWFGLAAVAASLLIGVVLWKRSLPNQQTAVEQVPIMASLNDPAVANSSRAGINKQFQRQKALFDEMQRVFDQRVAWVAESPHDVRFEFDTGLAENRNPLLCIRLVLSSKPAEPATQARTLWEMDVIVRSEQTVRIGDDPTAPELVLWPFMTEDGKVFVDSQINLSETFGLKNNQSHLLDPGAHAQQHQLNADLMLSQSVVLLNMPGI